MSRLVYNQVWEDYAVDRVALDVGADDAVLLVTSGGCNVLNTLLEGPRRIVTIDANPLQRALLEHKLDLIRRSTHAQLWDAYGTPAQRRRDSVYQRGSYARFSWVRTFINAVCGRAAVRRFVSSSTLEEQGAVWLNEIEPRLFGLAAHVMPAALAGVCGMHWRQVATTLHAGRFTLAGICRARLRHVMTSYPIRDNYFWHQMLTGEYAGPTQCPPYLRAENFERLQHNAAVVETNVGDLAGYLRAERPRSLTRMSLMDVPDFLSAAKRFELFAAVRHACAPGARVIYRSFAPDAPIPTQLNGDSPNGFRPASALTAQLSVAERTASYGAVHVYTT